MTRCKGLILCLGLALALAGGCAKEQKPGTSKEGDSCQRNGDCVEGLVCLDGSCPKDQTPGKDQDGKTDDDGSSLTCLENTQGDPDFRQNYGFLYSWNDAQNACPNGWHVPSSNEFQALYNNHEASWFMGTSWGGSSDPYFGFNALPAGIYYNNASQQNFIYFGNQAYFWSSNATGSNAATAFILPAKNMRSQAKTMGFSLRCVKQGY